MTRVRVPEYLCMCVRDTLVCVEQYILVFGQECALAHVPECLLV